MSVAPEDIREVSVIGLGPMGLPMATNLVAHGVTVSVWNRSDAAAEQAASAGARRAAHPSDLDGDIVISVLPDVDQLSDLLAGPTGLRAALTRTPGRLLVVSSTTAPERVRALAERLAPYGVAVADAPMSGGVEGAREATLSFMVGCAKPDFARLSAVLQLMGTTVERVGDPGTGSLAKLCNQVIVAGALASLGEALVLADRGGLDLDVLVRLLQGGLADSRVLRTKARRVLTDDYEGGGAARTQVKDLRYALASAEQLGVAAPVSTLTLDLFERALDAGWADKDHSVVAEVIRSMSATRDE